MNRLVWARWAALGLAVALWGTLPAGAGPALPAGLPDYYPAGYAAMVDASRAEGRVLVYSIMSASNWAPVIREFNRIYPWIRVETTDLGSYEVFERFLSEIGTGAATADMLISNAPDTWQDLLRRNLVSRYESPEKRHLPAWAVVQDAIYNVSSDPMVIVYNKKILRPDLQPKSIEEIARLAEQYPRTFQNRITTYDVEQSSTGFNNFWVFVAKHRGKAWEWFDAIGKTGVRPLVSAGPMVDGVISGEYLVAFFASTITIFPRLARPGVRDIIEWSYERDGTPIVLRGMGIPHAARNPNSAKLLLDFIVSQKGQVAFTEGGLVAYRPDVAKTARFHLQDLLAAIGPENALRYSYDPALLDPKARTDFVNRWKQAFRR
ncbi:MAG: extracellular solute-binding protein [Armatimonadota bacterium]|nr:extracellular solute-binding protein [Armatimonadota bacterium]MDR7548853.1 extracellular solute-binding protein [Armatimonadota bacterium]